MTENFRYSDVKKHLEILRKDLPLEYGSVHNASHKIQIDMRAERPGNPIVSATRWADLGNAIGGVPSADWMEVPQETREYITAACRAIGTLEPHYVPDQIKDEVPVLSPLRNRIANSVVEVTAYKIKDYAETYASREEAEIASARDMLHKALNASSLNTANYTAGFGQFIDDLLTVENIAELLTILKEGKP